MFKNKPWEPFVYYFIRDGFNEKYVIENYKSSETRKSVECSLSPFSSFIKFVIKKYNEFNIIQSKAGDCIEQNELYNEYKEYMENHYPKYNVDRSVSFRNNVINNRYGVEKRIRDGSIRVRVFCIESRAIQVSILYPM